MSLLKKHDSSLLTCENNSINGDFNDGLPNHLPSNRPHLERWEECVHRFLATAAIKNVSSTYGEAKIHAKVFRS